MSRVTPAGGDLAGRWLSKFLTDHLAGERDLSPQTIASYRDAIKLLLTWFRDVQATPPEKLRLADLDRTKVLGEELRQPAAGQLPGGWGDAAHCSAPSRATGPGMTYPNLAWTISATSGYASAVNCR